MQPLHQQGDAVEGLAAVVGGVAGQLMDLVDALVQSAGDIRLLADGLGNLVAGMGDPGQHAVDLVEYLGGGPHVLLAAVRGLGALAHAVGQLTGRLLQCLDHLVDLAGGAAGLLGQRPDLVGHHREATSLLAGPRRLDGRVERKQVGLIGDLADHLQDPADLLAVAGQPGQHGVVGVELVMELIDRGLGGGQRPQPLGGDLLHLAHQFAGLMGVARHVANGVAELGDGGGQLLALGPLLLQVDVDGLDIAPVIFGGLQDLLVGVGAAPPTALSSARFMRSASSRAARVSRRLV